MAALLQACWELMKLTPIRAMTSVVPGANLMKPPPGRGYPFIEREILRFFTSALARLFEKIPLSLTVAPEKSAQK